MSVLRLDLGLGSGELTVETATVDEVCPLLASRHYLGAIDGARYCFAGWRSDELVACQVYRQPTARMLPTDGTWLELSRWCLTPEAGPNAGSRMMRLCARLLRTLDPVAETLVSYSDPGRGHTGALYRASGWTNAPTHHERRWQTNGVGYPSGHGSWDGVEEQGPKQRWTYRLRRPR